MKAAVKRLTAWALRRRLVRTALVYGEHRGAVLADSITYRALFSVFAAVLLGFSAAALWLRGNDEAMATLTALLDQFIPGLTDLVDPSQVAAPTGFTVAGIAALIGLVGAAISAVGRLRVALGVLSDTPVGEPGPKWAIVLNLLLAVALGALLVLASVVSVLGSAGLQSLMDALGISRTAAVAAVLTRLVGLIIVFAIDTFAIVLSFRLLANLRAPARALWTGGMLGGAGLLILQEFSGLFVRGATSNPLLASFATLIALLLWFNLSAQVILLSSTYIIVGTRESHDRVRQVYGAQTLEDWKRLRAEDRLAAEQQGLRAAQERAAAEMTAPGET